ncbi:MAG: Uma2 family endonuclease [Thermoleophilaceae bacterium]|nr:Uma2 family endonuclease [Thermoleophilaceae bacterium]
MTTTFTRMTAEQYFAASTEGDRRQLVDGVMVVNEPGVRHAMAQMVLLTTLGIWTRGGEGRGAALPPVDVQMTDRDVYGPDVVWFREGRVPPDRDAAPPHIPDLAAEVRSPGTWRHDVGRKKSVYENHGLPELWLVDTAAKVVLVYRRAAPGSVVFDVELELGPGALLTSPLLPGFSLDLIELFGPPG